MNAAIESLKRSFEVELYEKGRKREYHVTLPNGEKLIYPGVTSVLNIIAKPALINWAKKITAESFEKALLGRLSGKKFVRMNLTSEWVEEIKAEALQRPDKVRDDAADLGTRVHGKIDDFIKAGKSPFLLEDEKPGFDNFLNWATRSGISLLMGDTAIASIMHSFGGKLDAAGTRNGEWGIVDFKTSNGIYSEYALQAGGAYARGFSETFGIAPAWAVIARFDKKDPNVFEAREVDDLDRSLRAFLLAKDLQEAMSGNFYRS